MSVPPAPLGCRLELCMSSNHLLTTAGVLELVLVLVLEPCDRVGLSCLAALPACLLRVLSHG